MVGRLTLGLYRPWGSVVDTPESPEELGHWQERDDDYRLWQERRPTRSLVYYARRPVHRAVRWGNRGNAYQGCAGKGNRAADPRENGSFPNH